jgi:hypothetical protein
MRAVGLFTRKREPGASSLNTIKRAKLLGRRKYVVKTLFTPHNSSSGPLLKSGNSGNPQLLPPAVAMPLNDSKSRLVLVVPPGAEVGAVTKLSRSVPDPPDQYFTGLSGSGSGSSLSKTKKF